MKCGYMGHFGEQITNDFTMEKYEKVDEYSDSKDYDPYFDDEDNTDYKKLKPSIRKDFSEYSDSPFDNYRFQYRQPGMIPVERPLKSLLSRADSGVTREYVEGDFVSPDKTVASVNSTDTTQSKTGRNLVLGIGAGLAALVLLNK